MLSTSTRSGGGAGSSKAAPSPAMRNGLWRYAELRQTGVGRERIRRLTRLHRGIYLHRQPDELDILRGLFLRLPEGVLLTMQSAAQLLWEPVVKLCGLFGWVW